MKGISTNTWVPEVTPRMGISVYIIAMCTRRTAVSLLPWISQRDSHVSCLLLTYRARIGPLDFTDTDSGRDDRPRRHLYWVFPWCPLNSTGYEFTEVTGCVNGVRHTEKVGGGDQDSCRGIRNFTATPWRGDRASVLPGGKRYERACFT